MTARPERESLRVVATNGLDSDFHALLLRLAFPPSWRADRWSGEERDPIPQRLDERDRKLRRGEYAGAGAVAALAGWGAYLMANAAAVIPPVPVPPLPLPLPPVPLPPVPLVPIPILPVLVGAGVIVGAGVLGMVGLGAAGPIAVAAAPVVAANGAPLHGAALVNAALAWWGGGALAAGGGGMAAGVQTIGILGAVFGGAGGAAVGGAVGGAVGAAIGGGGAALGGGAAAGGAAAAAPVAVAAAPAVGAAAGAVAAAPVAAAAGGALAGRMIGRVAVKRFLDAMEDPEKEKQLFLDVVERNQMNRFFHARYLKADIWDLPDSDSELNNKLWFDMAVLPRLASTSEGLTYIGTFHNGKMHGQGMLIISSNGKPVFFGEFRDGYPHGKAVVLRDFKAVAELRFKNGVVKRFHNLEETSFETYFFDTANFFQQRGSNACKKLGSFFSGELEKRQIDLPSSVVFDDALNAVTTGANGLRDVAEDAYARAVEFVSDERKVYVSFVEDSQSQNARKLVQRLRTNHGENISFQQGVRRAADLRRAINTCDMVIVILCDRYLKDPACIQELITAQRQNRVVIPLISCSSFKFNQFKNREASFYDVANSLTSETWNSLLVLNVLPLDLMSATEYLLRRESITVDVDFVGRSFEDDMGKVSKYVRRGFANL